MKDEHDVWLIYELSSEKTLGNSMFHIQGENRGNGDRIYEIKHQQFYTMIARDKSVLASLIFKMAQMLEVISTASMVHSDLKPENITVQFDKAGTRIESISLVDFGSSFSFDESLRFSGTTPEYLSPEMIHFSETLKQNPSIRT